MTTRLADFGVTLGNVVILQGINLEFRCGELTAVCGPNGAGKTTLLKAILGEIPHRGELLFMDSTGRRTGKPRVGYVPQRLDFDPASPVSVLDLFTAALSPFPAWLRGSQGVRRRVLRDLEQVQAAHLIDRRLGDLSGGELQRVMLALALDPKPELLLMDEPVSAVDSVGTQLFYSMVSSLRRRYDLSIILVSHDLEMVRRFADRVVLLNRTVIDWGRPDDVLSKGFNGGVRRW